MVPVPCGDCWGLGLVVVPPPCGCVFVEVEPVFVLGREVSIGAGSGFGKGDVDVGPGIGVTDGGDGPGIGVVDGGVSNGGHLNSPSITLHGGGGSHPLLASLHPSGQQICPVPQH